jgi:hypothetical protein
MYLLPLNGFLTQFRRIYAFLPLQNTFACRRESRRPLTSALSQERVAIKSEGAYIGHLTGLLPAAVLQLRWSLQLPPLLPRLSATGHSDSGEKSGRLQKKYSSCSLYNNDPIEFQGGEYPFASASDATLASKSDQAQHQVAPT